MFTLNIRTDGLRRRRVRVAQYLKQQAYSDVADKVIEGIQQQTAQGLSYTGEAFKPYTAEYARLRRKAGLQTARRDLRRSGALMLFLQLKGHRVVPDRTTKPRAKGQNYGVPSKNVPASPFMGTTPKSRAQARRALRMGFVNAMR